MCTPGVRRAIAWDWALLASYTLWLAYPVAWAVRRMVARAVPPGRALGWLYRQAHWTMGALVVSDIVENCATLHMHLPHWPTVLTVASSIKLLSLLLLAWVIVAGALAGRNGGRTPAPPTSSSPQLH